MIIVWAGGYCHAVAMTSRVHEKMRAFLVHNGVRPFESNKHARDQMQNPLHRHILSTLT